MFASNKVLFSNFFKIWKVLIFDYVKSPSLSTLMRQRPILKRFHCEVVNCVVGGSDDFLPTVTALMTDRNGRHRKVFDFLGSKVSKWFCLVNCRIYFSHKSHFWVMTKVSNEHKKLDDLMIGPDLETQFSNFVWFLALPRLEWNNHLWFEGRIYPKVMLKIY